MKTLRLILLGAVFTQLLSLSTAQAQYSARRLTRRIAPQLAPTNAPAPARQTGPAPVVQPQTPTPPVQRPVLTQAFVRPLPPPVDPEQARAARDEGVRKAVEFQKKRAEEGSESAQYELGLRYLKGDGVDKDEATGRKWLALSAKNGYTAANRKLEELDKLGKTDKTDKPAQPAKPPADTK